MGALDAVTSSGCVQGWAFDTQAPLTPLTVSVADDRGCELGWCRARHYREDLALAEYGGGWCAFRVRLDTPFACGAFDGLSLLERHSMKRIIRRCPMVYLSVSEPCFISIEELVRNDPTSLASLTQLRGCNGVLTEFIRRRGATNFVRAAYFYLLNRPPDATGLKSYAAHLKKTRMPAWEFLVMMADSDEYRARPRHHCSPVMTAFPFRAE